MYRFKVLMVKIVNIYIMHMCYISLINSYRVMSAHCSSFRPVIFALLTGFTEQYIIQMHKKKNILRCRFE